MLLFYVLKLTQYFICFVSIQCSVLTPLKPGELTCHLPQKVHVIQEGIYKLRTKQVRKSKQQRNR